MNLLDSLDKICQGIPVDPLPQFRPIDDSVIHAPFKNNDLNEQDRKQAVSNALRYFPPITHSILGPEFKEELISYGHIYMYRFRPHLGMKAYPINEYPGNLIDCKAIMLMIMNNLDPNIAQYPHELVTYGSNGQVFSNWAQFLLTMKYLAEMVDNQTLIMYSGHPLGLFPNRPIYDSYMNGSGDAGRELHRNSEYHPRMIISNGMMVPNYSNPDTYDKLFALGVTMYGQMTAGSFCYIGPQGIIHGTVITLRNVARKYFNTSELAGKVFVSSGLGGMSGAQAKATKIVGCIGVIAEICSKTIDKRLQQGWVDEVIEDLGICIERIRKARSHKECVSIAYQGNIVDLWKAIECDYEKTKEKLVDLGSDQTSLHNPYNGGYYPCGYSISESKEMMMRHPDTFKMAVKESLCLQVCSINSIVKRTGMVFWDYGNAFLIEASKLGADIYSPSDKSKFRYPSYVQDIMGEVFALGFGPFRWICTSGLDSDLIETDRIAIFILENLLNIYSLEENHVSAFNDLSTKLLTRAKILQLYEDNLNWIKHAASHPCSYLTVGTKARILYSDSRGRTDLACAFNDAVKSGILKGPVVVSRDHHDVSGADSPFRETSDIYDGSSFCSDMSVQNALGNVSRGATWVAIHNGGGVGWGRSINNGFGLVLDGSDGARQRAVSLLSWDVLHGMARRCWAKSSLKECFCGKGLTQEENKNILCHETKYLLDNMMQQDPLLKITLPYQNNYIL
ncbi:unnamed protein product [Gordionus sp. m RMFG-2023]|uniref:urocanate hydratase-like n=1 Tax=Gordionus sp. m RMFG-2023 TaxID=3053472 RepID=UPI0030E318ED